VNLSRYNPHSTQPNKRPSDLPHLPPEEGIADSNPYTYPQFVAGFRFFFHPFELARTRTQVSPFYLSTPVGPLSGNQYGFTFQASQSYTTNFKHALQNRQLFNGLTWSLIASLCKWNIFVNLNQEAFFLQFVNNKLVPTHNMKTVKSMLERHDINIKENNDSKINTNKTSSDNHSTNTTNTSSSSTSTSQSLRNAKTTSSSFFGIVYSYLFFSSHEEWSKDSPFLSYDLFPKGYQGTEEEEEEDDDDEDATTVADGDNDDDDEDDDIVNHARNAMQDDEDDDDDDYDDEDDIDPFVDLKFGPINWNEHTVSSFLTASTCAYPVGANTYPSRNRLTSVLFSFVPSTLTSF
jgi:hypothetical protein